MYAARPATIQSVSADAAALTFDERPGIVSLVGTTVSPGSYRLKITGQYQTNNYYCVPASSSMSLSTFGIRVAQGTLARLMRTTPKGTSGNNAATVIDGYIRRAHFDDTIVGDVVGRPAVLMDRIAYDVGTLHRAPLIQVWMERLPWNQGKIRGDRVGHAIIAYGYDRKTGTVTVFDPWRATGGTHALPASALAATLQPGAGMHYISRP